MSELPESRWSEVKTGLAVMLTLPRRERDTFLWTLDPDVRVAVHELAEVSETAGAFMSAPVINGRSIIHEIAATLDRQNPAQGLSL